MTLRLLRQLAAMLMVIWLVTSVVFVLMHSVPGDPLAVMLGDAVGMDEQALRAHLGLDVGLWHQYGQFLQGLWQGNWGYSLFYHQPVIELIWQRLSATLWLTMAALSVAVIMALLLGLLAAMYQGQWPDRIAMLLALLGMSIPNFVLGPVLIIVLAVELGWLPVSGMQSQGALILPALTLGTALAAILTRMLRASLLEVMSEEFIRTARAKGASELRVWLVHGLRNAFLPIVTLLGLQLGALLSGAVITETVFDWPGLGLLLVESIQRRDYPLVMGIILLITLFYVVINTLLEVIYGWLDPRIVHAREATR